MVVLLLAACALALRTIPIGDRVSIDRLAAILPMLRESWYGPLVGAALFTVGALLLLPVTALTLAAGVVFGPAVGIAVAWFGTTLSAALGHWIGQRLWRESLRRLAGDRLTALSQRLGRRGVLATALLRVVPVAPFMVMNLVAGATHVRARDFVIGTALGILPGTALLVLGADRARALLAEMGASPWLWLALAVLAGAGAIRPLTRLLRRPKPPTPEPR